MTCPEDVDYATIGKKIAEHRTFLVLSHLRPDGDAYGSSIAMALMLRSLGKSVTLWNEDGMLSKFQFLPGSDTLVASPDADTHDFDCVICLDTSVRARVGPRTLAAIGSFAEWINLDHHISNDRFGTLCHVDSAVPATGELLFDFFAANGWPIDPQIAVNLFAAISTDTGSFQYLKGSAKASKTFRVAASLVATGVDVADVSTRIYDCVSRERIELQKRAFNSIKFASEGRIAHLQVTRADIAEAGAQPDDTEGFVEAARGIDGVVAAAFFEQLSDGIVRVSLRSKDERVNVCEVAARFSGGGHRMAAGARTQGDLSDVRSAVVRALEEALPVN